MLNKDLKIPGIKIKKTGFSTTQLMSEFNSAYTEYQNLILEQFFTMELEKNVFTVDLVINKYQYGDAISPSKLTLSKLKQLAGKKINKYDSFSETDINSFINNCYGAIEKFLLTHDFISLRDSIVFETPFQLNGMTYDDMNYGKPYWGQGIEKSNNYGDTTKFKITGLITRRIN